MVVWCILVYRAFPVIRNNNNKKKDLKDEACQLAAVSHPKFRLVWLQKYDSRLIHNVKKHMKAKVAEALIKQRDYYRINSISCSSNNEENEEMN